MPAEENKMLITVYWPVAVPPMCLELALGTRVCAVRVDSAAALKDTVSGWLGDARRFSGHRSCCRN